MSKKIVALAAAAVVSISMMTPSVYAGEAKAKGKQPSCSAMAKKEGIKNKAERTAYVKKCKADRKAAKKEKQEDK